MVFGQRTSPPSLGSWPCWPRHMRLMSGMTGALVHPDCPELGVDVCRGAHGVRSARFARVPGDRRARVRVYGQRNVSPRSGASRRGPTSRIARESSDCAARATQSALSLQCAQQRAGFGARWKVGRDDSRRRGTDHASPLRPGRADRRLARRTSSRSVERVPRHPTRSVRRASTIPEFSARRSSSPRSIPCNFCCSRSSKTQWRRCARGHSTAEPFASRSDANDEYSVSWSRMTAQGRS